MSKRYVLGIHFDHNSSAAVLEDGVLKYAVQEERLVRVKNYGEWPELAIKEAFKDLPGMYQDVPLECAFAWEQIKRKGFWRREELLRGFSRDSISLKSRVRDILRNTPIIAEKINRKRALEMGERISTDTQVSAATVERLNHHMCHASSAYFGWGKMDEKVLVVTCDGQGDGICASVNIGHKGELERIAQIGYTHSIGRLYANITLVMGMMPLEHEYKLMGLAPYSQMSPGSVSVADEIESLFEFDKANPMEWKRIDCPPMRQSYGYLQKKLQGRRFDHIAAGIQLFIERWLVRWITTCIRETGIRKVALSGGVFMNVKANQRILEIPELEELFIFPSCGDESNSIGAAMLQYAKLHGKPPEPLGHLYLGNEYSAEEIETAYSKYQFRNNVRCDEHDDIEQVVARLLSKGEVVARFKGKMEFGARALGNRSILANPADGSVIRLINEMIKNRDFWMPFAPSVLEEKSDNYFIKSKEIASPYMMITLDSKEEKRDKIQAALHPYDGTGRPQEVIREWNPDYHRLISYFEEETGEALILNTSFNLHGDPIVCYPEDAFRTFDQSGLQRLAIGNFLLSKE